MHGREVGVDLIWWCTDVFSADIYFVLRVIDPREIDFFAEFETNRCIFYICGFCHWTVSLLVSFCFVNINLIFLMYIGVLQIVNILFQIK